MEYNQKASVTILFCSSHRTLKGYRFKKGGGQKTDNMESFFFFFSGHNSRAVRPRGQGKKASRYAKLSVSASQLLMAGKRSPASSTELEKEQLMRRTTPKRMPEK